MPKPTPMQEVKQRFGSKEDLAKSLISILERDEGVDTEEFERRIMTASNRQLLRLHRVQEVITKRFGSKKNLVDAIVSVKFPNGNDDYRNKLLRQRSTRLLDLYYSLR